MGQASLEAAVRVLVCGGRNFGTVPANTPNWRLEEARAKAKRERDFLWNWLDQHHRKSPIEVLIHGDARGADRAARDWAISRGIDMVLSFPADWRRYPRGAAGPIRNKQMLVEGRPDLVVAFPGGTGTANMCDQSRRRGVETIEVEYNDEAVS